MRYVLDSNVGAKWVLVEDLSDKADAFRAEVVAGVHELIAPDVYPIEVAHALTKAQRQARIAQHEIRLLLAEVLLTPPQFHPYLPLLDRAVDLAAAARMGVYDCLYVALAEREGCEVLTADVRMKRNLPKSPIVLLSSL